MPNFLVSAISGHEAPRALTAIALGAAIPRRRRGVDRNTVRNTESDRGLCRPAISCRSGREVTSGPQVAVIILGGVGYVAVRVTTRRREI